MGSDTENLISVIIPVYNVEAYVERCVTSVQNQTYKNLEVIIVDDGSTDRSGEICDSLSAADRRLKVIHKVNGGQSSARNAGIAAAHGNYIAFVDSDDFIHEEYISFMYGIAIESGAQIVICDYEKGNKSEFSVNISDNSYDMYTSSQMLKNWHAGLCAQETTNSSKRIISENVCNGYVLGNTDGIFICQGTRREFFLEIVVANWSCCYSWCVDTLLLHYISLCNVSGVRCLFINRKAMEGYRGTFFVYGCVCSYSCFCVSSNGSAYVFRVQGNRVN